MEAVTRKVTCLELTSLFDRMPLGVNNNADIHSFPTGNTSQSPAIFGLFSNYSRCVRNRQLHSTLF